MAESAGPHSAASGYHILYHFRGGKDGRTPYAGLIVVKGVLYGTTVNGGSGCGGYGCGTVYSVDSTGNEHVIYRFKGGNDGAGPYGGLVFKRGWLYGTTVQGGGTTQCLGTSCGTVFAVDPFGGKRERVLYRFPGGATGAILYAGLAKLDGVLYGMTLWGGNSAKCASAYLDRCGTVFAINTGGAEQVLHKFKGPPDGFLPFGPLLAHRGILFGMTSQGGAGNCCGTVFSITPTGSEHVIYRFKNLGYVDGVTPQGGLIEVRGKLFGTTPIGGYTSAGPCGYDGCGTVFAVTQAGAEHLVYRFKGGSDGASPVGTLIWDGSKFYGTTGEGGAVGTACPQGCGTVFSLTRSGQEQVLYRFQGGSDGRIPGASLVLLNGTLYGVTEQGGGKGCAGNGCGTVFALTLYPTSSQPQSVAVRVPIGQSITVHYGSGTAPTWTWFGD